MDLKVTKTIRHHETASEPEAVVSKTAAAGNLLFLSGVCGESFGHENSQAAEIESQVWGCFDNVDAALKEAGSTVENLIKLLILIRNLLWSILMCLVRGPKSSWESILMASSTLPPMAAAELAMALRKFS